MEKKSIVCPILPKIDSNLPLVQLKTLFLTVSEEYSFADPHFYIPSKIDLLFGANMYSELIFLERIRLGRKLSNLRNTHLGCIISGNAPAGMLHCKSTKHQSRKNISLIAQTSSIDELSKKFWIIERLSKRIFELRRLNKLH